jgi:hypothetical protein
MQVGTIFIGCGSAGAMRVSCGAAMRVIPHTRRILLAVERQRQADEDEHCYNRQHRHLEKTPLVPQLRGDAPAQQEHVLAANDKAGAR